MTVRFLQKRNGTALNPRNEQFYDSQILEVSLIHLILKPRNEKEAKAVNDIITIFKYNSAGLKGKAGVYLNCLIILELVTCIEVKRIQV